jgi:hypothetical protein
MKFRVFWDVAPCSYVEVDRHAPLKRRSTSTWLHGATSQKTLNFVLVFVTETRCLVLEVQTEFFRIKPHLYSKPHVNVPCLESYRFDQIIITVRWSATGNELFHILISHPLSHFNLSFPYRHSIPSLLAYFSLILSTSRHPASWPLSGYCNPLSIPHITWLCLKTIIWIVIVKTQTTQGYTHTW